ncbi:MAG: cytochrome C oxidase subunit IV family protein [Marinifilaceae bacterium]
MSKEAHHHIVSYRSYAYVLIALLVMTAISVAVTQIELDSLSVTVALLLACCKSLMVLMIFMHLKFDKKFYAYMVAGIFMLLASVIIITFIDYLYR